MLLSYQYHEILFYNLYKSLVAMPRKNPHLEIEINSRQELRSIVVDAL